MYLIEEHIIGKNHNLWKECDRLCYESKNLYNLTLYTINQEFEQSGKLLSSYDLYHKIKTHDCFKAMPNDVSKQSIFQVNSCWVNFFKALKSFKKDKKKFKGQPESPKYKHKTKGRNVVTVPLRCCRLKNDKILFNKNIKLELKTKINNLVEVKIVPQSNCYKIQVCYKKECDNNIESDNFIAIDLGVNNLATITNNFNKNAIIINGKPLKSINQYYNKKLAKLKSDLQKNHKKHNSNSTKKLTQDRNNKIKHFLHNSSKKIVDYCVSNNVSQIVIGYNEGWKNEINIGSVNNQKFVQIPYLTFINQIKYKAALKGIIVTLNEESYTSKCSALDLEPIQKHETYLGKRVKRGLFKTSKGVLINSDENGSLNIGRKAFGNDFVKLNRGQVISPLKVNPLKTAIPLD